MSKSDFSPSLPAIADDNGCKIRSLLVEVIVLLREAQQEPTPAVIVALQFLIFMGLPACSTSGQGILALRLSYKKIVQSLLGFRVGAMQEPSKEGYKKSLLTASCRC